MYIVKVLSVYATDPLQIANVVDVLAPGSNPKKAKGTYVVPLVTCPAEISINPDPLIPV